MAHFQRERPRVRGTLTMRIYSPRTGAFPRPPRTRPPPFRHDASQQRAADKPRE